MKRALTFLLAFTLILSSIATLSSCGGHKCNFATDWSYDNTNHWHACLDEECVEISENSLHEWDAGQITTKATQDSDGVMTYTCSVCSHTKTESISFTGMTEDEWNLIIHPEKLENFTMEIDMLIEFPSMSIQANAVMIMKFTEEDAYMYAEAAGQVFEQIGKGAGAESVADIVAVLDFDNFTYDTEAKAYRTKEKISLPWVGAATMDVTLRFENDRLVGMEYSYPETDEDSGLETICNCTASFVDYGTTVIPNA